LTNCIISDNTITDYGALIGPGVCFNASTGTVANSAIASNTFLPSAHEVYRKIVLLNSTMNIANSIVWDGIEPYYPSSASITYSNTYQLTGVYPGEGNINVDPLFVGGGDYHLTASSPCIDTGTPVGAPSVDIEGSLRPQGLGYDMGAYEFSSNLPPVANANGPYVAAC